MKNRNWFWGIFFLLSAVFVIFSQTHFLHEIGIMSTLATVFFAGIIISSLSKREFFGIFISLAFLYMIYDEPLNLMHISPWLLILAASLLSMSFSLLFPKRRHKKHAYTSNMAEQMGRVSGNTDDNNPYINVKLNSTSRYLHSENLKSGHFISSLSKLDVYFDQAELCSDGAEIYLDCNLGTINLYVPTHWNVTDNINSYLGDVRHRPEHHKASKDAPQLALIGKVKLGDINIYYI